MVLALYYDLMSQPSRSLYTLLKVCNIPFESRTVDLRKGAHYSDEYAKINRFQKVPVIDNDGFVLTESIAIIRYLSKCKLVPDKYYPRDLQPQARVDEFLEWYHAGLRLHTAMYFRVAFLDPLISGKPADPKNVKSYFNRMSNALDDLETKWLGRGTDFVAANNLTVADIWAACELEQLNMTDYNPREGRPNLTNWIEKVRTELSPYYEEAHAIINKIARKKTSNI